MHARTDKELKKIWGKLYYSPLGALMTVRQFTRKGWRRLCRFTIRKRKLSTRNLERLCRENATTESTLVVHSEDVDHQQDFPNAYTVTKRADMPANLHVDVHYRELSRVPDGSYPVILCTGLLEHIPDPQRLIGEFRRILQPGGRLIISASAVFSFHECPDNFFHFTPYGFRLLFKDWSEIKVLRGASQPFETIGILLQRILLHCDMVPIVRPFVELAAHVARAGDWFILRQYDTRQIQDETSEIDSMLPSNVQAVVVK